MMLVVLMTLTARGAPPLWSDVDLEAVLGVVSVSEGVNGTRGALASGGLVRVHIADTVEAAETVFDGERRTAATTWSTSSESPPGDEAAGDGNQLLLIRDRNAVVFVRDLKGQATDVAERVRARLTRE